MEMKIAKKMTFSKEDHDYGVIAIFYVPNIFEKLKCYSIGTLHATVFWVSLLLYIDYIFYCGLYLIAIR